MDTSDASLTALRQELAGARRLARLALALSAVGWIAAAIAVWRTLPPSQIVLKDGASTATLTANELRFVSANGDQAWLAMTPAPQLQMVRGFPQVRLAVSPITTREYPEPFGMLELNGGGNHAAPVEMQPSSK